MPPNYSINHEELINDTFKNIKISEFNLLFIKTEEFVDIVLYV